jgi:hypothetical protein
MKKIRYLPVLFIVSVIFLAACAKPPVEEINNAIAAVSRAENDPDVTAYAANALARARESLAQMQTEVDAKRYDAAKRLAADAQSLAEKAISDGRTAAARIRDEAANAVTAAQSAVDETEQTLNGARRTPPRGLDMPALERDFNNARTTVDQALIAQNEKRYREAIDKSQSARSALSSITSRLSQTVMATSRKK